MKKLYPALLLLTSMAIVGCKADDAMDSAIDMKKQMAGLGASTRNMEDQTRKLNDDGIRLQKVGEGMKLMYDPESRKDYIPPPTGMMAGAKLVAENANSLELMEFFYVTIKSINKAIPDETKRDATTHNFPADYARQFNRDKKHVNVGMLKAVAAQIPQPMVERIVSEQIFGGGGRYSDAAIAMLMLRAKFLEDFYLNEGVFDGEVDNVGKVEKAFEYVSNLEFIVGLPFADKIQFLSSGMLSPEEDYAYHLQLDTKADPRNKIPAKEAVTWFWWNKLAKSIDRLPDELLLPSSPYLRRLSEIREIAQRYADEHAVKD